MPEEHAVNAAAQVTRASARDVSITANLPGGTALTGHLAQYAGIGAKIEWDVEKMECTNKPELNRFVRRAAVGVAADYGDGIVKLVSDTVRRWDAKTISDRIENAVGRDLQFIRINGTVVGGLVGLVIHSVEASF